MAIFASLLSLPSFIKLSTLSCQKSMFPCIRSVSSLYRVDKASSSLWIYSNLNSYFTLSCLLKSVCKATSSLVIISPSPFRTLVASYFSSESVCTPELIFSAFLWAIISSIKVKCSASSPFDNYFSNSAFSCCRERHSALKIFAI